jgi:hypothetical protein
MYPYLAISILNLISSCSICNKGKSDKEVEQAIFGNYFKPQEAGKRPLAKLTQDILKEFYEII